MLRNIGHEEQGLAQDWPCSISHHQGPVLGWYMGVRGSRVTGLQGGLIEALQHRLGLATRGGLIEASRLALWR